MSAPNVKPKQVRTIGTNVGRAILDAGYERPKSSRPAGKPNRKRRRRPAAKGKRASVVVIDEAQGIPPHIEQRQHAASVMARIAKAAQK